MNLHLVIYHPYPPLTPQMLRPWNNREFCVEVKELGAWKMLGEYIFNVV